MKENSWFADVFARYTYKRTEFQLNIDNILNKSMYERVYFEH